MTFSNTARTLVIDANAVVHGSWGLTSPVWRVSLYQARSGLVQVIVPEVVVREIVGRYESELRSRTSKADRSIRALEELTGTESHPLVIDVENAVREYEDRLRSTLSLAGVFVPPLPQVDLSRLVDRAIGRKRPFDDAGSGFRDSLLWETVIGAALENPLSEVVLISNDARAFKASESSDLHADLLDDLSSRGEIGKVTLFEHLAAYFDEAGYGAPSLVAQIVEDLDKDQPGLRSHVEHALVGAELSSELAPGASAVVTGIAEALVRFSRAAAGESEQVVLVHLTVEAGLAMRISAQGQTTSEFQFTSPSFALTSTASYDKEGHVFEALEVEAPAFDGIPTLLEELERRRPASVANRRALGAQHFPPLVLDQIAAISKIQPDFLSQIAAISKIQPDFLSQIGEINKIQPGIFDQIADISKIRLPPDVLDQIAQIGYASDRGKITEELPDEVDEPTEGDDDENQ